MVLSYNPGEGMAPYAVPQQANQLAGTPQLTAGGTFNVANYTGLTDYEKQKLASIASGRDFFMADSFMSQLKGKYNDPTTVVGQGEAWLTPDQLRAKTGQLDSNLWSGQMGGSGGSGGGAVTGGTPAAPTNGLFNSDNQSQQQQNPTNATPSGISGFPNIGTGSPSAYNPVMGNINGIGAGQTGGFGSIPGSQISGGQPVEMMQMGAGNALQNYYNTPGYQLTNGQGAVNQFQTSPGYQFAVDQALKQVQQQGASRGLLDSGAGLRAMTDRAQGMANQEFNNWQQNQQNQYNQYQNRLQGLASGPVGAEQAYGLGQGVANNAMQTGSNIGSILANQGNSLFGGLVGAGGAQAQNVTQAGNMQAQILGNNMQTQMMLAALAAGGRSGN